MKGEIIIRGSDTGVSIEVCAGLSRVDKVAILDGLANALELSEVDRLGVSMGIAAGGIDKLLGGTPSSVKIDTAMIDKLRRKGEQNETDAL